MMIHRTAWLSFTICALGIFLYGCFNSATPSAPIPFDTPSVEQMDKSPFAGIPCAAPCWYNLEVGKSSENDVIALLPTLTFIEQDSIQMFRTSMPNYDFTASAPGVNIVASCVHSNEECLDLRVVDDVLTKIVVELNYEIKVDEAIGYLGNPNYIGYDNIGSERVICEVYLVWSDTRLVLASTFEGIEGSDAVEKNCHVVRDTGKVPSNLLILEARYLSNAELIAKLKTGTGKFFEYSGVFTEK